MRLGIIISLLLILTSANAQDVHFSQFFHSPIFQSPANIGSFEGDYRAVFNQRTQWRSITEPYNTWAFSADAREIKNIPNTSLGMIFFKDAAGDSPLRTVSISPGVSYQVYTNPDSLAFVNVGLQIGYTQKTLDFERLNFDNQYTGSVFDPSLPQGENFGNDRSSYLDINLGVNYSQQYSREFNYQLGMSLFHVNSPKENFLNDEGVNLDRRFLFHGQGAYVFNKEWSAIPAFQWQAQGKYREFLLGGMAKRTLLEKYGLYRAVYMGLFGRTRDALYVVGAMDYDNWKVGISYDINLSDLRQVSRNRGGFEFSVIYIFKGINEVYKKHRQCPTFI